MRYIDTTALLAKQTNWGSPTDLWTDPQLRKDFKDFFHKKCWYSEAWVGMSDIHIDHFRPKAKVIQYENFDFNTPLANSGYYWLRNDITNYRASCAFCNRKTGDGGKGNFFPLQPGSPRLTPNGNETEQPLLLDPCNQQDVRIISFLVKDVICASIQPGDNDRVKASTVIYNLNHPDIVDKRAKVWEAVAQAIASYNAGNMNQTECLRQLNLYTARDAECSACAIACVNSLAPDEIKALLNLQL